MKDKELERIMNDEMDGLATPEDSEKLKRRLAASEEVRVQYQKLSAAFAALSGVEMVEPPRDLKQNVMRAIRLHPESVPVRKGWLDLIGAAFRKRPMFRYAYSFAAGAGVGVLLFALVTGGVLMKSRAENSPFAGTMLPASNLAGFQRLDSREFRLREGRVTIEALLHRDGVVARVGAGVLGGTEISVSFDPSILTAVAVRQRRSGGTEISLGAGQLRIRFNERGENQYLLYLTRTRPAGSQLRVVIRSADEVYQGELQTGAFRSGG